MNTPKKIFIRKIDNGRKISVGEYIRVRWNNVIHPFNVTDSLRGREEMKALISRFKQVNKREVVAVLKTRDKDTEEFIKAIGVSESY